MGGNTFNVVNPRLKIGIPTEIEIHCMLHDSATVEASDVVCKFPMILPYHAFHICFFLGAVQYIMVRVTICWFDRLNKGGCELRVCRQGCVLVGESFGGCVYAVVGSNSNGSDR